MVAPDFLDIDSQLSDEEKLVRSTARRFVSEQVQPLIREAFSSATFPTQIIPALGEMGFLGANLDGYGLPGMSNVEYGLLLKELERCDSGLRSFASVQGSLVMFPILTFGTDEQKRKYLPKLAAGRLIGAFGLTEPGFGSNPSGMTTTATPDGDHFILNGEKTWITNGGIAHLAVVFARAPDGIHGFLLERDTPGFTTSNLHGKLSMRASFTSSLSFSDCRIPRANMLPNARGLRAALQCLNQARFGIGWGVLGAAEDCFETARQYTLTRRQFDSKPIASHQLVQLSLADMITALTQGQLLALHCGRLKDQGRLKPEHISLLKRNNVRIALDIARSSRDLLGANGIMEEYSPMRHMANLESVLTYEGTENIHTLVLGEALTGIPAYR
ncbi:MAG: acyl-CoA dehydrogenase family protein [Bryobacter sp.]|jgi:glutaryl-CoA dehydrogenase|nr:acyl-CoA dehydrogenase family protein [Bryobacter sp. CoA8 C33]